MTIDLLNAIVADSGITQKELAKRLGVTEGRISQVLSGSQNISLKKLAAIGWALGLRFHIVPDAAVPRESTPAAGDQPLQTRLGEIQAALEASFGER